MSSYVPPHMRNKPAPPPSAQPAPQGNQPRNSSYGGSDNRRNFSRGDPTRQPQARQQQTNRFQNIFSGYDSAPKGNNYRGRGGFGGGYGGGYNGGYGRRDRRGGRRGGKAQMELSLTPQPALERELFGDEADHMTAGIDFHKYDDIPVEVSGQACPPDINDFESAGLDGRLLANIKRCNFVVPTPIQKFSIPIVCQRRDLMACAQTGSGKTAAFLFPVIHNLLTQQSIAPPESSRRRSCFYPRALVLSPTRELSQQIHAQARKFLYCTGMRSVCIYGGSPIGEQFRELDGGVHVLVATPGRLYDMLERGRISLCQCEYLTLDEADRMLDMGFEPQIRQIVEQCDLITPAEGRNTLMFSATFPVEIQELAQDFLIDYIFVAVGRVGSTTDLITQQLRQVHDRDKQHALFELLQECEGRKLVFCATKRTCDQLEWQLNDAGFNSAAIHGDKVQREREHALKSFRKGKVEILTATDVAARGLDIPNVLWVIQYDLPSSIDDYIHRIGRTGRCGNSGTAISFVNHNNKNVFRPLLDLLIESNQEVPSWFKNMAQSSYGRGGKRNGRYGGRDYRKGQKSHYHNKGSGRNNNRGFGNRSSRREDAW